ncbi:PHP domain-containing protein [Clostridium beijerinckii]|jgi:Predicted metal-dependent phosphoesterases (PHP family)|uniref:PHP domain-containing protein n=2 Tax=Clostridium beijerinckii TaxID=1520 RepID=A0A1S8R0N4_CLOBE|nr:PHP domain-containing protein [Clostridium beijerinckii]ABR36579.1 PHP C-terminal domain protein [Clostridium beijerinckii NCIMB 8052]AIU03159.1 phosphotransferase domain-containing protein [Clostridium beijerinckii ATCC 35702]MBE6088298.1 PHP domain-containing protein [Clostridium beijerinckii]MBF7808773.1 PHP domain-containing protein [Clostridium beijerinckii]NRT22352.1 hypothetical protein [Clostridium beijerinckii]
MYKKGDFHIHSTFSDGKCTPRELVILSKKREVDIISITDHNSTSGLDEAVMAGENLGVRVIPGVELSTKYNSSRVHVLGYFKDDSYKNELLVEVLKNVKNHKISNIKKLLGKNLDFYNTKDKLSVETGIKILKFFGATVVLAHPVLLNKSDFEKIIEMDFDGLEAKYFSNTENDTEYFLKVASDRNLLYTAGSDFHSCKEFYRIHGIIGDVYLNESEIYNFLIRGKLPYL